MTVYIINIIALSLPRKSLCKRPEYCSTLPSKEMGVANIIVSNLGKLNPSPIYLPMATTIIFSSYGMLSSSLLIFSLSLELLPPCNNNTCSVLLINILKSSSACSLNLVIIIGVLPLSKQSRTSPTICSLRSSAFITFAYASFIFHGSPIFCNLVNLGYIICSMPCFSALPAERYTRPWAGTRRPSAPPNGGWA